MFDLDLDTVVKSFGALILLFIAYMLIEEQITKNKRK
jgi:hypothetical protein